jgi:hypothetical protein
MESFSASTMSQSTFLKHCLSLYLWSLHLYPDPCFRMSPAIHNFHQSTDDIPPPYLTIIDDDIESYITDILTSQIDPLIAKVFLCVLFIVVI